MDALQTTKAYTKCLIEHMSFIDEVQYDTIASSFSHTNWQQSLLTKSPHISTKRHMACLRQASRITPTSCEHLPLPSTKTPSPSSCPFLACHGMTSTSEATTPTTVPWTTWSQKLKNMRWDRRGYQVRQVMQWSGRSFIPCLRLLVICMQLLTRGSFWQLYSLFNGKELVALTMQ